MSIEAMKLMVAEMEYVLSCINEDKIPFDGDDFHEALRLGRQAIEQAQKHDYKVTHNEDGTFSVALPDGEELRIVPPQRQPLTDELPELPQFFDFHKQPLTGWYGRVYTEDQMKAYATEAVKAAHGIKE